MQLVNIDVDSCFSHTLSKVLRVPKMTLSRTETKDEEKVESGWCPRFPHFSVIWFLTCF